MISYKLKLYIFNFFQMHVKSNRDISCAEKSSKESPVISGSYQEAKISAQLSLDHNLINFLSSAQ